MKIMQLIIANSAKNNTDPPPPTHTHKHTDTPHTQKRTTTEVLPCSGQQFKMTGGLKPVLQA